MKTFSLPRTQIPRVLILGALALFLGGCGAIESLGSGALTDDRKASIRGNFFLTHLGPSRVTLLPLSSDEVGTPLVGYAGKVNLPAGRQRLFVNRCSAAASLLSCRDPWFAEFEAEAGREYRVGAGRREHYWIIDTVTGRLVADSRIDRAYSISTAAF